MALEQYSDTFWFPNGVLASSMAATVFPKGSSAPAQLWADSSGTVPLPNPLSTNSFGVLAFFATVGEYWVHIDTETFSVDVGMSQEQSDLSTGVSSGGEMNINSLNPKAVDIHPLVGYIVSNNNLTQTSPTITRVDYPGATVVLDAAAQLRTRTFWILDGLGNVVQQGSFPTNEQFRTHLVIGTSFYDIVAGSLIEVQSIPVILNQPGNQFVDLLNALGPFNISGNVISANGANLSLNKTSGRIFSRSFSHFSSGVLTNNPHITTIPSRTIAQFRRAVQGPVAATPPVVTTIDPANYDVGGVVTPVGGGVNSATIQRVFLLPAEDIPSQLIVQYGQIVYSTLANANAAIGSGNFVPFTGASFAALIGYISVIRSATNLSDPTQAIFTRAGKFATP